jgi:hypothetical protein
MYQKVFLLVFTLGVGAGLPEASRAHDPKPRAEHNLAAEVQAVFRARCTACHGPELPRPKGRFGYVLDLGRVAANPEMVIPSRPEESELWALVSHDEMPPPDAPSGPLTAREKDVIRDWIAAGAPAADPSQPVAMPQGEAAVTPAARSPTWRVFLWLGKFHLLVLHFPIALLAAARVAELWAARRGVTVPSQAVRFCLWLGAAAAVPTVVLGWLHAASGHGDASPGLLTMHRWLGTAVGLWAVATAVLCERDSRRGVRSRLVFVMTTAAALFVAAAGHFGGILTHGADFFDW